MEIRTPNFHVHVLQEDAGATYVDHEISIKGEKLIVYVEAPSQWNFYLRFDDVNSSPIPVRHKSEFRFPFNRIFFNGSIKGKITFISLYNPDHEITWPDELQGANSVQALAAGNNLTIDKRVRGIYVESFGDLVVNCGGANQTISDIPAFTFLEISPLQIVNTSTCNIQLIYDI